MDFNISQLAETLTFYVTQYGLRIIVALLVFIIGRMIAKGVANGSKKVMLKASVDETLAAFLKNIIYYALLAAVVIAALGQAGINVTSFLAVLGAAGLAVGLALKDSLSNFAAGVMLILLKFFRKGDYVTVGGQSGTVSAINIFNTVLTTPDNKVITVPNSAVLGGTITNVTANDTRRVDMVFGIGYDDDLLKAKKTLERIISEEPRILPEPAPVIQVNELGDSSVNFVVRPWCKTGDYWGVYFAITEKVKLVFDAEGISIPYPQTDVHVYPTDKQ
ncbi:MAG: mechanosensitive ion channel family protein [Pseudodesulfovibrio sp.]|jgi:small conductance mechanosensitive channel|uniref:Mechanosensitive ion channel protein MscS n=1 Tax=Pseudodesulfovibrio indicus TaxID=1716143 RepID=A0A126QRJ5_9BACT|nr:mechanosensitive ion channel domain-containing protein [Pseudodesulfovibrio indicus]AMK12337.1 mechanosensitive ion channel protein MscS [Pseudodesulfovibrio indicus]TDT90625.1 small conductance mechanosensitive channel [Pseudodesulfovibrio indicus]